VAALDKKTMPFPCAAASGAAPAARPYKTVQLKKMLRGIPSNADNGYGGALV